ncbi:Transcriptional regulator, contains XRE-family HTH domain [Tistlia consotensis]|uniref:Transcriptional regulator, contains XRE-family HTH domain n=1 Tax=Tistlia consotensis USBA 355 TaxID=560819 RepID=A0A1Y6BY73_9PROT|nr:helix-turn-helix transcriptional regulator [Tistlia consotensis]SMF27155.1 Transcriptional regulator, contains XRE-family HTH domain [Tistlia consotensis USBA 355]SNR66431.1 Transcriptional regulator, contains XRE-family HTH domain [Tistlia consotensis]
MGSSEAIGRRLVEARAGLSQRSAAKLLGIGVNTLGRYENGGTSPDVAWLLEVAAPRLRVSPHWLIFGDPPEGVDATADGELDVKLLERSLAETRAAAAGRAKPLPTDREALVAALYYGHLARGSGSDPEADATFLQQLLAAV